MIFITINIIIHVIGSEKRGKMLKFDTFFKLSPLKGTKSHRLYSWFIGTLALSLKKSNVRNPSYVLIWSGGAPKWGIKRPFFDRTRGHHTHTGSGQGMKLLASVDQWLIFSACVRGTVVVLCVCVCYHTSCYIPGVYVANKVPLSFLWHFQCRYYVDFVENALFKSFGDICWSPWPSSLLD